MRNLLYPAIALMNRLSFAMKFGLMCLLFSLPLLICYFYLVSSSWHEFVETREKLTNLSLLRDGQALVDETLILRDQVWISAQIGLTDENSDLETLIDHQSIAIQQRLQALQYKELPERYQEEFEAQQGQMKGDLDRIRNESSVHRQETGKNLLDHSEVLLSFIAEASGLSQDTDLQIQRLSNLSVVQTSRVMEMLGRARAVGSYTLGLGYLNAETGQQMNALSDELVKLQREYQHQIQAALTGVASQSDVMKTAQSSQESIAATIDAFENNILLAQDLTMQWNDYHQQISSEILKTSSLNTNILTMLDNKLQDRLARCQTLIKWLLAALLLVLFTIFYFYAGFYVSVRTTLSQLVNMLGNVASGDMTARFKINSQDELGELGKSFNYTIENIQVLVTLVNETASVVEQQAGDVAEISAECNQAVAEQRQRIEQVAASMNQMTSNAEVVAQSASNAAEGASSVNRECVNAGNLVASQASSIELLAGEIEHTMASIDRLATDSANIGQVLEVIKSIAEQTNLLALNAAIEAARAGERGRSFAVVADEVRNLARRTHLSTEKIEQMIARLRAGVDTTVIAMNSSHRMMTDTVEQSAAVRQALGNILVALNQIVEQNQQIATAAEQQTLVTQEIDRNLVEIDRDSEVTATGAGKTEQASRKLGAQVEQLKKSIAVFRVR
ncbi:methyl-accepting chemotaxis protein [Pseudomonas umsongensis]|nr:methyl-accepting chemotaxis protein [Pseudomonas umsongensis]NWL19157.1 methyl-accepting chemotaxis protein [Pseudomonas umsongensis]